MYFNIHVNFVFIIYLYICFSFVYLFVYFVALQISTPFQLVTLCPQTARIYHVIIVVKIYILFIDTIFFIINNLNWRLSFPLSSRPTSYTSTPEHQLLQLVIQSD